jgi:hypothetical protein
VPPKHSPPPTTATSEKLRQSPEKSLSNHAAKESLKSVPADQVVKATVTDGVRVGVHTIAVFTVYTVYSNVNQNKKATTRQAAPAMGVTVGAPELASVACAGWVTITPKRKVRGALHQVQPTADGKTASRPAYDVDDDTVMVVQHEVRGKVLIHIYPTQQYYAAPPLPAAKHVSAAINNDVAASVAAVDAAFADFLDEQPAASTSNNAALIDERLPSANDDDAAPADKKAKKKKKKDEYEKVVANSVHGRGAANSYRTQLYSERSERRNEQQ